MAVRNAMLRCVRKGLVLIGIMIVFKVDLLSLKITLPNWLKSPRLIQALGILLPQA